MFIVSFLIKALALPGLSINDDDDYLDKVLRIFCESYSKFANTAHNSNMFGVVYSSIQKFTIILIMKPIIFISIMNKYLDISIYLDNLTPL